MLKVPKVRPVTVVRIAAPPAFCEGSGKWEVWVNLPVYSDKLAHRAYCGLPATIEIDGYTYRKGGFKGSILAAWYVRVEG